MGKNAADSRVDEKRDKTDRVARSTHTIQFTHFTSHTSIHTFHTIHDTHFTNTNTNIGHFLPVGKVSAHSSLVVDRALILCAHALRQADDLF